MSIKSRKWCCLKPERSLNILVFNPSIYIIITFRKYYFAESRSLGKGTPVLDKYLEGSIRRFPHSIVLCSIPIGAGATV